MASRHVILLIHDVSKVTLLGCAIGIDVAFKNNCLTINFSKKSGSVGMSSFSTVVDGAARHHTFLPRIVIPSFKSTSVLQLLTQYLTFKCNPIHFASGA